MIVECEECGLTYCDDEPDDVKEHRQRHRRRSAAFAELGYLPATYRAQEAMKSEGWALIIEGKTVEEKVLGAEKVLRGWFDRSLQAAIVGRYWRKHPKFPEFVRMMFCPPFSSFDAPVQDALAEKYGAPIEVGIPSGASYWFPPGSEPWYQQKMASESWQRNRATAA